MAETYSAKLRMSASVTASTGAASARAVSAVTIRSTLRPMVAKTCAINEPCCFHDLSTLLYTLAILVQLVKDSQQILPRLPRAVGMIPRDISQQNRL